MTAPVRLVPKRTSIDCGERIQPSRIRWLKSAAEPKAGGLLRIERGVGGDQVRQVLAAADLRDLVGVVQRAVRVRAQVGQEAADDEPADMSAVMFAGSP
ncbi:hypothetical protein AB0E83_09190 [Streptomyces sp. NPDC035033]|uniref:hypothetical protein n=1 Tax=Streptomyces sp. NPDC035033 TaxID=3155368 RepID=UPI0033BFC551